MDKVKIVITREHTIETIYLEEWDVRCHNYSPPPIPVSKRIRSLGKLSPLEIELEGKIKRTKTKLRKKH